MSCRAVAFPNFCLHLSNQSWRMVVYKHPIELRVTLHWYKMALDMTG